MAGCSFARLYQYLYAGFVLIKNKYTRDFVTYNTDSTESFWIMFPILNLIVYYKMIKDCRSDKGLKEKNSALLKLFVKGQLVTYLIRNY